MDEMNAYDAVTQISKEFNFTIQNFYNQESTFHVFNLNIPSTSTELAAHLHEKHPTWMVQSKSSIFTPTEQNLTIPGIVQTFQRQSGLFQLQIPDSGVLPVSPATLSRIHGLTPNVQFSVTTTRPLSFQDGFDGSPVMNRLYEDIRLDDNGNQVFESFNDQMAARNALTKLVPPLGDSGRDVFFGRFDNQKVSLDLLLERVKSYGKVCFARLCNRGVLRDDHGKDKVIRERQTLSN